MMLNLRAQLGICINTVPSQDRALVSQAVVEEARIKPREGVGVLAHPF